jgi:hypothetical protein
VGLERDPLSLVSTFEELLGRNRSGSGLQNLKYGRGDRFADHATPSILKLALSSSKSGNDSVGIVRSWTKDMEFVYSLA